MTADLFTSDLHLGHVMVARHRGFDNVQEHDEHIRENWVKQVQPRDRVFLLGDICAGGAASTTAALEFCATLPGEIHLILGNHDAAHPMHRDAFKQQRRFMDVFASVQTYARRRVHGRSVLLSHFPYTTDRTVEVRHMQYRLPDHGEFLLHGHTHSNSKYTSNRELHIGLDAWGMNLVPLGEVAAWIQGQIEEETHIADDLEGEFDGTDH